MLFELHAILKWSFWSFSPWDCLPAKILANMRSFLPASLCPKKQCDTKSQWAHNKLEFRCKHQADSPGPIFLQSPDHLISRALPCEAEEQSEWTLVKHTSHSKEIYGFLNLVVEPSIPNIKATGKHNSCPIFLGFREYVTPSYWKDLNLDFYQVLKPNPVSCDKPLLLSSWHHGKLLIRRKLRLEKHYKPKGYNSKRQSFACQAKQKPLISSESQVYFPL